MAHAEEDTTVSIENTVEMRAALKAAGLNVEKYLFAAGQHGLGLAGPAGSQRGAGRKCSTSGLRRERSGEIPKPHQFRAYRHRGGMSCSLFKRQSFVEQLYRRMNEGPVVGKLETSSEWPTCGSARRSTDPVIGGSAYRSGETVRYPQNGQLPFGTLDVCNFVVRKTRAFLVQEVQEFANFFRSKR